MECEPGRVTVLYEPPSDYPGMQKFFALFLMTFRNSIGDLAPPDYAFWINETEEFEIEPDVKDTAIKSYYRYIFIILVWIVWVFQIVFMIILLLNFLIADISEKYEMVIGERTLNVYHDKASLNKEYYEIMKELKFIMKKVDDSIAYMIFTISSDIILEEDSEAWQGFVEAIKRHINKRDDGMKEKIKSLSEKVGKIEMKFDKDVGEIKFMLKNLTTLVMEKKEENVVSK
jgi:hypothetical protein